jgi:hypothetical protein
MSTKIGRLKMDRPTIWTRFRVEVYVSRKDPDVDNLGDDNELIAMSEAFLEKLSALARENNSARMIFIAEEY